MALRRAMRCTPIDEHGGHDRRQPLRHRRDGERDAEDQHVEERGERRARPRRAMIVTIMTMAMTTTTTPRSLPVRSSSRCSGVGSSGVSFRRPAMRPISVLHAGGGHDRPAAPVGRRRAAEDHVVRGRRAPTSLGDRRRCPSTTGRLSPVSAASAVCSAVDSISRASAGMVSPSSIRRMSPGTISVAGTLRRSPSRMTVRVGGRHRAQRRDRRLGARLLDVAHGRVEQDDGEDGDRLVRAAPRRARSTHSAGRDRRGDEQQDDEHILELREESPPGRDRRLGRQLVASSACESRCRVLAGQALPLVGLERGDDVLNALAVRNTRVCSVAYGMRRHARDVTAWRLSALVLGL